MFNFEHVSAMAARASVLFLFSTPSVRDTMARCVGAIVNKRFWSCMRCACTSYDDNAFLIDRSISSRCVTVASTFKLRLFGVCSIAGKITLDSKSTNFCRIADSFSPLFVKL